MCQKAKSDKVLTTAPHLAPASACDHFLGYVAVAGSGVQKRRRHAETENSFALLLPGTLLLRAGSRLAFTPPAAAAALLGLARSMASAAASRRTGAACCWLDWPTCCIAASALLLAGPGQDLPCPLHGPAAAMMNKMNTTAHMPPRPCMSTSG